MQPATQRPVLVVDDDDPIRDALRFVLEDAGYTVATAANGREALERARTTRPRLILLDLMMPVMDGWAFCRVQHDDPVLRDVPVLVVSALVDQEARRCCDHAAAHLQKPIDMDALVSAVNRFALT